MESMPPPFDYTQVYRTAAQRPQSPPFAQSSSVYVHPAIQRITWRSAAGRLRVADATHNTIQHATPTDATCIAHRCDMRRTKMQHAMLTDAPCSAH
jgi:hypothetical protein